MIAYQALEKIKIASANLSKLPAANTTDSWLVELPLPTGE